MNNKLIQEEKEIIDEIEEMFGVAFDEHHEDRRDDKGYYSRYYQKFRRNVKFLYDPIDKAGLIQNCYPEFKQATEVRKEQPDPNHYWNYYFLNAW